MIFTEMRARNGIIMTRLRALIIVMSGQRSTDVMDTTQLRERWRAASMDTVWLRPGDWYCPEVDAVLDAFTEERDPTAALERLGRARSEMGVGLGETLDDVLCLLRALGHEEADWAYIRCTAQAWAESMYDSVQTASMIDAASNMTTLEYLKVRLKEVYAAAHAHHRNISQEYCLIIIDAVTDDVDHWHQMQRSFTLGAAMADVFYQGETVATAGPPSGRVVVLAPRDEAVLDVTRRLRETMDTYMARLQRSSAARGPARIWIESLPGDYELACALINGLAR